MEPHGVERGLVEHQPVHDLFTFFFVGKSAEEPVPNDQNAAVVLVKAVEVCSYGQNLVGFFMTFHKFRVRLLKIDTPINLFFKIESHLTRKKFVKNKHENV